MFGEITGVLIWLASFVKVLGYSWQAFQQTFQPFPGGAGSGTGASAKVGALGLNSTAVGSHAAASVVGRIPLVGGALNAAAGYLQGIFTPGPHVPQSELGRLEKLPAPPNAIVQKLVRAHNGKGGDVASAANELQAWARTHGWKVPQDVNGFLGYLGITVFGGQGQSP